MGSLRNATVFAAFAAALLMCALFPARHASAALMDDVSKELEYTEALVKSGVEKGDLASFATAHRTLSNLAVTSQKLDSPRDRVLALLSIGYFYIRMCGDLPILQISKATNPDGLGIDCAKLAGDNMSEAIKIAENQLQPTDAADARFLAGLGYDALSGYMAAIPSRDPAPFHQKAIDNIKRAVELGASFGGANTILARLSAAAPASRASIVSRETFTQTHRSMYMERALTPPKSLENITTSSKPAPAADTFLDYRWRFSIARPDSSWEFASSSTRTNLKLTVRQRPGKQPAKPPLTLVAHDLSPEESVLAPSALVDRSVQLLQQAGYTLESRSEADFKGKPATEVVLSSAYNDIVSKGKKDDGAPAGISTKHYMFIVVANGIEYILSFNTLSESYASAFPDMRALANTLEIF